MLADDVTVPLALAVAGIDAIGDNESEEDMEALIDAELLEEVLALTDHDLVSDDEKLMLAEAEAILLTDVDGDSDAEWLLDPVIESDGLKLDDIETLLLKLSLQLVDRDIDVLPVTEIDADTVCETLNELFPLLLAVAAVLAVVEIERVAEREALPDVVTVVLLVRIVLSETLIVTLIVGDCDADAVIDADKLTLDVASTLPLALWLAVALSDVLAVREADAETVNDTLEELVVVIVDEASTLDEVDGDDDAEREALPDVVTVLLVLRLAL